VQARTADICTHTQLSISLWKLQVSTCQQSVCLWTEETAVQWPAGICLQINCFCTHTHTVIGQFMKTQWTKGTAVQWPAGKCLQINCYVNGHTSRSQLPTDFLKEFQLAWPVPVLIRRSGLSKIPLVYGQPLGNLQKLRISGRTANFKDCFHVSVRVHKGNTSSGASFVIETELHSEPSSSAVDPSAENQRAFQIPRLNFKW
jgi:hypothetical protein